MFIIQVNSQQDNSKFKYEKIKKMLNNPFVKFSLGFVGLGTIGIAAKLIYDKLNNKNIESEKIDEIKLDANDKKFIAKNFFLCQWKNNSCWNDVFIQFLMCPEYRCKKFKSAKINAIITIINDFLNQKYGGNPLSRSKLFKPHERPIPDGLESWLTDGGKHCSLVGEKYRKYNGLSLIDLGILDQMSNFCGCRLEKEDFLPTTTLKKVNNYFIEFDDKRYKNQIFTTKSKGFYPTFISILDNVHYKKLPHRFACYIIYDKNKEAKYFLLADGLKDSMKILSKEQGLKELQQYSVFEVKYSSEEIVNEFYTLED